MERDKEQREKRKIEQFTDLHDKHVLEIGCGDGRVTAWFADQAKKYVAIDPDSQRIAQAKATIPGVEFRIGSGECLDLENASFDVVLFTLSLHHQESRLALQEAHRVLREGGQLIILEPAVDGEMQQFFNMFFDETEVLKKTRKVIESSEFEFEQQETFYSEWTFENKEELYNYDFGYQHGELDDRLIEKIDGQLGAKLHAQPIHLKDKLLIFSLRKRKSNVH
jgi:ubiquinone/menaquinone biosynthesis C-methylase UbiE